MTNNDHQNGDVESAGAIVKAANEWLHPLVPYGPRAALKEMTRRIMALDTAQGEYKMKSDEAAHLAQVAASSQLNPFTGEIWAWVQIKANRRNFQVYPGRRGLLRHAHEQAAERGTAFWPEYHEIKDEDKRADLKIPKEALAFECRLADKIQIECWLKTIDTMKGIFEPDEIRSAAGSKPYTYGLGILTAEEMADLDRRGNNRMTHVERCQKRAYMMALKQQYNLPLGANIGRAGQTMEDYVLEAEWREVEAEEEESGQEAPAPAEDQSRLVEKLKEVEVIPQDANPFHVAALLKHNPFPNDAPLDHQVRFFLLYREAKIAGDLKTHEAIEAAKGQWIDWAVSGGIDPQQMPAWVDGYLND